MSNGIGGAAMANLAPATADAELLRLLGSSATAAGTTGPQKRTLFSSGVQASVTEVNRHDEFIVITSIAGFVKSTGAGMEGIRLYYASNPETPATFERNIAGWTPQPNANIPLVFSEVFPDGIALPPGNFNGTATATSLTAPHLTIGAALFTVDEFRGANIRAGNSYGRIVSNTTTTLTLDNYGWSRGGQPAGTSTFIIDKPSLLQWAAATPVNAICPASLRIGVINGSNLNDAARIFDIRVSGRIVPFKGSRWDFTV